ARTDPQYGGDAERRPGCPRICAIPAQQRDGYGSDHGYRERNGQKDEGQHQCVALPRVGCSASSSSASSVFASTSATRPRMIRIATVMPIASSTTGNNHSHAFRSEYSGLKRLYSL